MTQEMAMAHVWLGRYLKKMLNDEVNPWYEELHHTESVASIENTQNSEYIRDLKENSILLKAHYERLFQLLQEDMPASLGIDNGVPDKHQMQLVVANIIGCCLNLKMWEMANLQSIPESVRLQQCRTELKGFTRPTIAELNRMADFMATHFMVYPVPLVNFELNLIPGTDMERLQRILDNFIENPEPDKRPQRGSGNWLRTLGILYLSDLLWPFNKDG
ncbi:MAG: hypothetical protein H6601_02365 [Flavobacteriales bacterium]|nr:hypothetical protein [Flavobacteriales bacterium]